MALRRRRGGFGYTQPPLPGNLLMDAARILLPLTQQQQQQEEEEPQIRPKHPLDEAKLRQELQQGDVDLDQSAFDLSKAQTEFERGTVDRDVAEEAALRQSGYAEAEPDVRAAVEPALRARRTGELSPDTEALLSKTLARFPEMADQILSGAKTESEITENEAQAQEALRPPQSTARDPGDDPRNYDVVRDQISGRILGYVRKTDRQFFPLDQEQLPENAGSRLPVSILKDINDMESAQAAIKTIDRRLSEFRAQPLVNLLEKEADLDRLTATINSAATIVGKAQGEQRLTDIDREVFSGQLAPSRLRIILSEMGGPNRVEKALHDAQVAMYELQTSKRGAVENLFNVQLPGAPPPVRLDASGREGLPTPGSTPLSPEDEALLEQWRQRNGGGQ